MVSGGWIDLNLIYDQNIPSIKESNISIFTGAMHVRSVVANVIVHRMVYPRL